eukprot:SAG11_NODE_682_length_7769_cov_45.167275_10_plen_104_part_00
MQAYDSAKAGGGKKKKKKKAKAKPKAAASPKAEGPPRGTYIDVPFKDRSAENLGTYDCKSSILRFGKSSFSPLFSSWARGQGIVSVCLAKKLRLNFSVLIFRV